MSHDVLHRGFRWQRLIWPLLVVAVAAIAMTASVLMAWTHAPAPSLHDEFGNLLVADTLLHGRLANPPPPFWQPFQSFHVLVDPSYASKYPLGPGALLALGSWCWGSPVAGIWLGAALCAAAVTWAAAGCLPRGQAVFAGLLLALNAGVHDAWSLCYLNGWLTATAGALVAGSVLRLRKRARRIDCIVLGIGVGGLALTRPFEGLQFTLVAAGLLLYWRRQHSWKQQAVHGARIALWAGGPLLAALCLLAAHNRATTGSLTQMAYQRHESQYAVAPLNIFQKAKEPAMSRWSVDVPPAIVEFHYGWSLRSYQARTDLRGWCEGAAKQLQMIAGFWGAAFCLVATLSLVRSGAAYWPMAAAIALALLVGTFIPWYFTHYFAPSLVWLVILTALGLRRLMNRYAPDRMSWRLGGVVLLTVQVMFLAVEIRAANTRPYTWADQRQQLGERLERNGGQHLILVRYKPGHNVHREWVFNGADLEQAPVLWARSWRSDLDARLVQHYGSQRRIWVLEVDQHDRAELRSWADAPSADSPGDGVATAANLRSQ